MNDREWISVTLEDSFMERCRENPIALLNEICRQVHALGYEIDTAKVAAKDYEGDILCVSPPRYRFVVCVRAPK